MTHQSTVDANKISKEMFKRKIFNVAPGFEIDDRVKPIMNNLFKYVNDEPGELDPSKGILIWGNVGTGKSTIIRILGEILRLKGQGYMTVNCSHLVTQFAAEGLEVLNSSTYNQSDIGSRPVNRAFDELGREPIPAKHYGNELNVIQYVFQCRYELRERVRTFATTNIRPEGLEKLYGTYIYDRIGEMFNIIEMSGPSRRPVISE